MSIRNHRLWPVPRVRRFLDDNRGGVALLFGLAALPLIGIAGAAIDYSVASRDRALLQATVDSAALAVAKMPLGTPAAAVRRLADSTISTNYRTATQRMPSFTATKEPDLTRVIATDRVPRRFRLIPGVNPLMDISVEAQVRWGTANVEIALVLDNTGSMASSNKMDELKRALCGDPACLSTNPAAGFIKIIREASTRPQQFMVGLVPFDVNVRVPLAWQAVVNAAAPVSAPFPGGAGPGYCMHPSLTDAAQSVGFYRFATRDKDLGSGNMMAGIDVGAGCGAPRVAPATWNGCLGDRDLVGDFDTRDLLDPTVMTQRHPAVACFSASLARMMPMADARASTASIITAIRSMQPAGNTNLSIGISWGTAMLTSREPFTQARPPGDSVRRTMILLTDGENTQSKHSNGPGGIDPRAQLACDFAKQQGITIYAIRVIEGNRTLLRNCASSPAHYLEVTQAAQLNATFQQIATEISVLHLSR